MNWKSLFYTGAAFLVLFEIARVYLIMPMPGSQQMDSIAIAYFLNEWRWGFRIVFALLLIAGIASAFQGNKWLAGLMLAFTGVVIYLFNFQMLADKMFCQTENLQMVNGANNKVGLDKLVLGIELNGQTKAYPIQYIGYHHQVRDTLGGEPIMVTYCTVCRSGRVFSPKIGGKSETFRLVGMDHFNAMFEDATTKSWWRQESGEAVAGPMKGCFLLEYEISQTSLGEWLHKFPNSLIMQADSLYSEDYNDLATYDTGLNRGKLTGTDTLSWKDKSWVIGIMTDRKNSRAFDWNRLKKERIINQKIGEQPIVLVLANDDKSFFAYYRPDDYMEFSLKNDTLSNGSSSWNLSGKSLDPDLPDLKKIAAYQEFWHSWRSFHPHTTKY